MKMQWMTDRAAAAPAVIKRKTASQVRADEIQAQISKELASAEAASAVGDIETEEHHLYVAGQKVRGAPFSRRTTIQQWANREFDKKISSGQLRRGASLISVVGAELIVYNDRLVRGEDCRVMTAGIEATVVIDGQVMTSSRPTLTRMAFGSVLPGSALLVGLAVPKTSTDDRRSAQFMITHAQWSYTVPLNPDLASETRPVAAQINAISRTLELSTDRPATPARSPLSEKLTQLERIASLVESGGLSTEQAESLRREIVGL